MTARPAIVDLIAFKCLLLAFAAPGSLHAQVDDLRMPVVIDAESTRFDGNTSMVEFTGLKLTQGGISIEADVAHATRTDFDDSTWRFTGNVVFDVNAGHIESDNADLRFADFELQVATIEGSPASFRFRREGAEEPTYAEARRLHYDVKAGVIEFSGDAMISEGGNRIASETLVYNIRERRVNAVSSGDPDNRVKVTYTPPAADERGDAEDAASTSAGDEDDNAPGDDSADGNGSE